MTGAVWVEILTEDEQMMMRLSLVVEGDYVRKRRVLGQALVGEPWFLLCSVTRDRPIRMARGTRPPPMPPPIPAPMRRLESASSEEPTLDEDIPYPFDEHNDRDD